MRKTTTWMLAGLCALAFASCSKEEKPAPAAKSTKEILMASQWKKSEYKENGVTTPFFGSCEMDDVLSFTATDCNVDGGAVACSTPQSGDTYFIDADNKTMRWMYGAGEITFGANNTSFTFKRTGANTFEYIFTKK